MESDTMKEESGMEKRQYEYKGAVKEFDRIVEDNWYGVTWAVTPEKARSNLVYRYKMETDRLAGSRISLPGKIKEVA